MIDSILIVEDSRAFRNLLARRLGDAFSACITQAASMEEAKALLACSDRCFDLSILDYNLPDAPAGEVLDLLADHAVPSIVLTAEADDQARTLAWQKPIIDFVQKEDLSTIDYITLLIERIRTNPLIGVLIVDDSPAARQYLRRLLELHKYHVLEAESGSQALDIIRSNPNVKLTIADYYMPHMNGIELTKEIRQLFSKEDMAIIGVSAYDIPRSISTFLRTGANDYIKKPFTPDEFYCRINQNIDMLNLVEKNRNLANKDFLTNLYNRRYFFDVAKKIASGSRRRGKSLCLAMLDVDHFKKINDTFGHEGGDKALKALAQYLAQRFRESDIVARLGGEEFAILGVDMGPEHAFTVLEGVRHDIENLSVRSGGKPIRLTASIGAVNSTSPDIFEMLRQADANLYAAKSGGRNRVVVS